MSKKDTKNTPAKKDNSMVEVRVINNYFDKDNNKKFRSVDDVYKTDKDRAEELVRLGYVVYTDEDSNVADDNVDPNVNDEGTPNTNEDDSNADDNVDHNVNDNGDEDTNVDPNVNDEGTPDVNEDDSNADDNVDPNADDSNVPNE